MAMRNVIKRTAAAILFTNTNNSYDGSYDGFSSYIIVLPKFEETQVDSKPNCQRVNVIPLTEIARFAE